MNDLGVRAGLAAALFAGLSATLAACPGPAPSTGTGAAGGSGSTSDTGSVATSSTTTSTTSITSSTTSTSTGVTCVVPGDCPHPPACYEATCDSSACGMKPADPGAQCSDKGGKVCDGVGNCVECVGPTDCVDPSTPPPACASFTYNAPPVCDLVTHTCKDVDPVDCAKTHQICTPLGCDSCTADTDCGPAMVAPCVGNACEGGMCTMKKHLQGGDCMGGTCSSAGMCVQRRYVFVTSMPVPPTFGTASHADMKCQGFASAANLGGTWKAWITDATSSPAQWMSNNLQVPYFLLDDMNQVAQDFTALTTMNLDHAIDLDEKGNTLANGVVAWTGSKANGTSTNTNCSNWTSAMAPNTATVGDVTATGSSWSAIGNPQSCTMSGRLYCFQQ